MGKGKPRHNPDKKANKMPHKCSYYEERSDGKSICENGGLTPTKCNGNWHSCIKNLYHKLATNK